MIDESVLENDSGLIFYHKMYEDLGCEAAQSSSCLNCPLPQCVHDNPRWHQENQQREKDMPIILALEMASPWKMRLHDLGLLYAQCTGAWPGARSMMRIKGSASL